MKDTYKSAIDFWDRVFSKKQPASSPKPTTNYPVIDDALLWLGKDDINVLDVGFGTGMMLFVLAGHFSGHFYGIEASKAALEHARDLFAGVSHLDVDLRLGSDKTLAEIPEKSMDAVILSNIVDQLTDEDGLRMIEETDRILKKGGRVFLKLNPYLQDKECERYGLKKIASELYQDNNGMYLWNLSDARWHEVLEPFFIIAKEQRIDLEHHGQTNRLFLLKKRRK